MPLGDRAPRCTERVASSAAYEVRRDEVGVKRNQRFCYLAKSLILFTSRRGMNLLVLSRRN